MKKILISGYYGFDNFGDEAILSVLLNHLKGQDVTVLSANPEKTGKTYNVNSINSFNTELVMKRISNFDVLISGGGSLLQNVTSNRSLFYYCGLIQMLTAIKKDVKSVQIFCVPRLGTRLPRFGTRSTTPWYSEYHALVFGVPRL